MVRSIVASPLLHQDSEAKIMKKTPCDSLPDSDSTRASEIINAAVNCLALEHERFGAALIGLGAASASLAANPMDAELRRRARRAWSALKADLWSHLQRETDLIFEWTELRAPASNDFVEELSREQHKLRELIRRIEADAPDHEETAHSQAQAFVAIVNLLDHHIEWQQQTAFLTIRKTVARAVAENPPCDTLEPILLPTAVTNTQAPNV
jgi:hypothetical protein